MKKLSLLLVPLVFFAELGTSQTASAQEVQITGPLAGAPAVRRMRRYRAGRLQLEPDFSFTLQDEYSRSLIAGLHAGYYFTDWLGIGAWGGYAVANLNTNLTDQIQSQGVTTDRNRLSLPSRDNFDQQIGQIQWVAALQLEFSPLRGKLAIFEKLFVDTDFYIFLGGALVGLEERSDIQGSSCRDGAGMAIGTCFSDSQLARSTRVTAAVTFGAGLTMYFNDFVGLNLNWRGLPFSWNNSGFDDSGNASGGDFPDDVVDAKDRFFRLNHMFTIGVVIYLPTSPDVTE